MNDLVPLHFEQADVRMVMLDGVPWWVLADIAECLDLSNPTKLARRLEDYQKAALTIREGSSGQRRRMNLVNEAGVYALTLNSRKPQARAFAHWLFTEVLPSIRRYGQYPPPQYALDDPDRAQDLRSTPQQRFIAECQRLAEANSTTVAELLHHVISPQQQRAIELGHGPMVELLHKDRRWEMFLGIGMDLQYVLRGVWGQTPQERRVIAQMRAAQASHQIEAAPSQDALSCEP